MTLVFFLNRVCLAKVPSEGFQAKKSKVGSVVQVILSNNTGFFMFFSKVCVCVYVCVSFFWGGVSWRFMAGLGRCLS